MSHHFFSKTVYKLTAINSPKTKKVSLWKLFLFWIYIICIKICFENIYLFVDKIVYGYFPYYLSTHISCKASLQHKQIHLMTTFLLTKLSDCFNSWFGNHRITFFLSPIILFFLLKFQYPHYFFCK